jgi:predicted  nucleic acid-binding Zn-ribbon protein
VAKLVHNCCNCGKTLIGKSVKGKCVKCANVSFSNLPDQLVTEDSVGNISAPILSTSADVSTCEIVPLK